MYSTATCKHMTSYIATQIIYIRTVSKYIQSHAVLHAIQYNDLDNQDTDQDTVILTTLGKSD